jgi:putative glutamine amidotransferase
MSSDKIKIGVTFSESRYENYPKWIKGNDEHIEIVELSWQKQNWDEIEDCDGIVLTGGVDTNPKFYDNERTDYPNHPEKWNEERDEFEMHVFETALNIGHPILAICRGMQLVNVSLGGDLIQDLEEAGKADHRRHGDVDGTHAISITSNSLLEQVANTRAGNINSAHHQSVGNLSDELMISAVSPDGVIEAAEWKEKEGEPWLLCVQWHPERMKDNDTNPLAKNIREKFLEEVNRNKNASN